MKKILLLIACLFSLSAFGDEVTQCDIVTSKIPADAQILDVRSRVEYQLGHVPNAKLIPHKSLAERLGELNPKNPVIVYCHSGYRAGVAEKILRDNGFEKVSQLQGHWSAWDSELSASMCPQ